MKMRMVVWVAALATALAAGACARRAPPPAQAAELRLVVEGMHCEACAQGITRKLARRGGVLGTEVHFSNAVQTVRYDAARVSEAELLAAVSNAGFKAAVAPQP